jgi:hypothetical protein
VNQLLQNYSIQVDYPDVSGSEHLEVLQIRDRLAEAESGFTDEERAILVEADRKLMMNTMKIYQVFRCIKLFTKWFGSINEVANHTERFKKCLVWRLDYIRYALRTNV